MNFILANKKNINKGFIFDLYKYNFLNRILIKLHTRALGVRYERLFIILPVLIYLSDMQDDLILKTKEFLLNTIKPNNLAIKVYDRVIIKLFNYKKDVNCFIQDKHKAFDIFNQHIQLYGIVDEILGDDFKEVKKIIVSNIRKHYDESYKIDSITKKLLEFQEKHYN